MDITYVLIVKALIAIGAGTLIGLEREHHSEDAFVIAGARTYPLVALLGFILSVLSWYGPGSAPTYPYIVHVGLVITALYAAMLIYIRYKQGHYGVTSAMALIITYIIGSLVGLGETILNIYTVLGVFTGVVATYFLIEKRRIHRIAEELSSKEIISATEFILVLLVLFPLALSIEGPVDPYNLIGPGLLFDPGWFLAVVIFVSVVSFMSFMLMRVYQSQKGLLFAGLLGGFVSSEAASATVASAVKENKDLMDSAMGGIFMSIISLVIRDFALCIISSQDLRFLGPLAIVFSIIILMISIFIVLSPHTPPKSGEVNISLPTPFSVRPAFKFALVFAIMAAAVTLLSGWLGDYGLLSVSLGGLVSSSAIAASVARDVARLGISIKTAQMSIIIAVGFAILNKLFITYFMHRPLYNRIKYRIIALAMMVFALSMLPFILPELG